jgi:hypothetical protein
VCTEGHELVSQPQIPDTSRKAEAKSQAFF